MQDNRYIDLHCDTITMLHYPRENLTDNKRMVSIADMEKGETLVQCFSAFVPTGFFPKPVRDKTVWNRFNRIADKKDALLELHKASLAPVYGTDDIEFCKDNKKIGVLFTIEDTGVIGNDIAKLEAAYDRGVRIAGLTWNHENTLAFPNSAKPAVMEKGLKDFGIMAIERMNELGMVIDVSHLSDGGFWDVARLSKLPFIATHSNSRAVTNHPRNLTDGMIKALAEKGGVTGLNFAPDFLSGKKGKKSKIDDMVKHILHIRNVGGSGVLAIGTDFDGIHGKLEIGTPSGMPMLFEALIKAGLTQSEIDKMKSGNIMRVFNEVWK